MHLGPHQRGERDGESFPLNCFELGTDSPSSTDAIPIIVLGFAAVSVGRAELALLVRRVEEVGGAVQEVLVGLEAVESCHPD